MGEINIAPILAFVGVMLGAWFLLNATMSKTSQAEERLERVARPKSLAEIEMKAKPENADRYKGLKDAVKNMGGMLEPQSELEKNTLKVKLANAGFRSEAAPQIYQGARVICFVVLGGFGLVAGYFQGDQIQVKMMIAAIFGMIGFYGPSLFLSMTISARQKEIFLTLPDALDLMVVCVESGLGLDAAMRKVTEEMKGHAKVLCEEFALANLQLQMGRPRREVLHDLGVRTGVDDVKSLAAILIQADRFGSSIATALRVQSDSMRTRRKQIAEEKAAKTAVQLIFPLVLFIFPGIFVVLVGPAAILIAKNLGNLG
jgi:tight adherence protein C